MLPARSLAALVSAAVLLALAVAAPAQGAEMTRKKAIWGPLTVNGEPAMKTYAELGVGIYQSRLFWNYTAPRKPENPRDPADPAYRWPAAMDQAIRDAEAYGLDVMVQISGVPEWSSGYKYPWYTPRRMKDFADFVEAAARRYPEVRLWAICNEPSRTTGLNPPVTKGASYAKKSRERGQYYARLLDMSYKRLKKISRSNVVIGGNSYASNGGAPGFQPARRWIRNLKLPNGKPPRMDMYGHNPFGSRKPDIRKKPRSRDELDISDTDDLIKEVNKRLRRNKRKKMKVYLMEYAVQTDHVSAVFPNFFVSQDTQAEWVKAALRIARRTKGVYTLGYFRLEDQDLPDDNAEALWGLMNSDYQPKPAFYAWRDG